MPACPCLLWKSLIALYTFIINHFLKMLTIYMPTFTSLATMIFLNLKCTLLGEGIYTHNLYAVKISFTNLLIPLSSTDSNASRFHLSESCEQIILVFIPANTRANNLKNLLYYENINYHSHLFITMITVQYTEPRCWFPIQEKDFILTRVFLNYSLLSAAG